MLQGHEMCEGGEGQKKIENGVVKRRFLSDSFSVARRQHKQHDGQVHRKKGVENAKELHKKQEVAT